MRCIKRLYRNLALRLISTFVVAVLLLLSVIYLYIYAVNPDLLIQKIMRKQIDFLAHHITTDTRGIPVSVTLPDDKSWFQMILRDDLKYRVITKDGKVILSSDNDMTPFDADGTEFSAARSYLYSSNEHRDYIISRKLHTSSGDYLLQAFSSNRILDLFQLTRVEPISHIAIFIALLFFLLITIIVIITIRYMLKPLQVASAIAAGITPQNLQQRLNIDKLPSEVVPLVEAFNSALDRLTYGFQVQQELLATTAHELKTPLSLLRGEIEMSDNLPSRQLLLKDIDQMVRQVHQLLHLAEVREAHNYQFEPAELIEITGEVTNYLARLAATHQVALNLHYPQDIINVRADSSTLFILIKNLIENAITHAPAGSTVDIWINEEQLQVRDYGTGIAEEHFELLFSKFWRGPARRNEGAGLGLAICREIASMHGWTLSAQNAQPGAKFTLHLAGLSSYQ
ncbi:ATP-binding protein [Chromatiaceae bacterium AAb-1]|nr:ATP-binding protein [Chromatiaceae bacterium AAb-1]